MPSPEVVRKALSVIKRTADHRYFFEHLNSPIWIEALAAEGLFSEPPGAEFNGEFVRFPMWPESTYLARMAALDPEAVLDMILKIPETDNTRVIQDLVDAAIAMPVALSVRLVGRAKNWAQVPIQMLLPEKLSDFASHIARGGHVDEALGLLEVVLEVAPDPRFESQDEASVEEALYRPTPEPRARFDLWEYERILDNHLADLISAGGLKTLRMLTRLLDSALKISAKGQGQRATDYSYIWRSAIEADPQYSSHGVSDALISAVRDAAMALAREGNLEEVIQLLEDEIFPVFKRIALHVLRSTSGAAAIGLINQRLSEPKFVGDTATHHEFWLLARDRLNEVEETTRNQLFKAIDQGPDLARIRERLGPESEEELEGYSKDWKLRRLSILRDVLDEEHLQQLHELERELGRPEHPDLMTYMGEVRTGPNSPKTADEIVEMTVGELTDYLRDWQPSGDWMAPSPEGLSRQLTETVAADPQRFSLEATKFKNLQPTYVRGVLRGFEEAQKVGRLFSWNSVVELCEWVIQQPVAVSETKELEEEEQGWNWTRRSIASLLSSGFDSGDNQLPFELRKEAWEILLPLTDDSEPTPEYEAEYGGTNMDPATLSINTTRGEAIHAVIRYGLWVRRHHEAKAGPNDLLARTLDEMPEVRKVLEKHLNESEDPSLAVRACYGQWFPWLILLDEDWAKRNVSAVFPEGDSELKGAAWDAYVTFCQPYESSLRVLEDVYRWAVERLPQRSASERSIGDPDERLAQHLMTYYWQGKLTLSESSLLGEFFEFAPAHLRAQALEFIGRAFWNSSDVTLRIIDRAVALWEKRSSQAVSGQTLEAFRGELEAFGWWFASNKFEDPWALEKLLAVLRLTRKVQADHLVAERLADIASRFPVECISAMRLMVEGDEDGWSVLGWRDSAEKIIEAAFASGRSDASDKGEQLVHYLGARGHREFGELLRKRQSNP